MRPEKDSEVWTKSDEQRKRAGFEFAAEPMEVLLLFPTIYYMAGMSVLIVILSIVLWITFPLMWDYFVWSVSSTLSIGLIIFLPEYFSNIISFAIHLCYWIAFSIYIFVYIIQFAVGMSKAKNAFDEVAAGRGQSYEDKGYEVFHKLETSYYRCSVPMLLLTILVTLLIFRMTFYY